VKRETLPPRNSTSNEAVSVVIPTKNSARTIARCIKCVLQEKPGEIIAVDALSTDGTVEILKKYGVTVLNDKSGSLAHQRRLGVENARGPLVMFVDSDVELGKDCISQLRHDLTKLGWAAAYARILSAENVSYWQKAVDEEFSVTENALGPKKRIGTAATLFRKELLLRYPFDPNLTQSYEDVDLSRRLVRDNYVLGGSSAFVFHYHRRGFLAFAKQRFRGGIGKAQIGAKYHEGLLVVLADPFVSVLSRMVRSTGTRRVRLIPYWAVKGWCEFMGVLVGFSKVRRAISVRVS
jgi:glycosyltransferase involved in cell wall biosynthesis